MSDLPERLRLYAATPSVVPVIERLEATVAELRQQRDRFREHSVKLNSIAWRLGILAGHIDPERDDKVHGDEMEWLSDVESRVAELQERLNSIAALHDSFRCKCSGNLDPCQTWRLATGEQP